MTPPYLCQLAGQWNRALPLWCVGEQKIDGVRALWLRDRDGCPRLFTRDGYEIAGTEHIEHELRAWERHAGEPLFLDGEFVVGGGSDTFANTKAWYASGYKLGGTAGRFNVFDGFAYDDWCRGGTEMPLHQRKARLEQLALALMSDENHRWEWRPGSLGADCDEPVRMVPHQELLHVDDALVMVVEMWRAGLEGIVLKDAAAGYSRTRNSAWRKVGRPWQAKIRWQLSA